MTATIRTSGLPAGFHVKPHVQALADEVEKELELNSFGTYAGHEATDPKTGKQGAFPDRAMDIFVNKDQGDRLSAWLIRPEIMAKYGIDYVIWWQRIYNPEIAPYWRDMPDRGGITQNHKDHNHVSFLETAPAQPNQPGDISMADAASLDKHLSDVNGFLGQRLAEMLHDAQVRDDQNKAALKALQAEVDAIKQKIGA